MQTFDSVKAFEITEKQMENLDSTNTYLIMKEQRRINYSILFYKIFKEIQDFLNKKFDYVMENKLESCVDIHIKDKFIFNFIFPENTKYWNGDKNISKQTRKEIENYLNFMHNFCYEANILIPEHNEKYNLKFYPNFKIPSNPSNHV